MFDAYGGILKAQVANIGLGDPLESSSTLARKTISARDKIAGDGTTSNPGLANSDLRGMSIATVTQLVGQYRYDVLFGQNLRKEFTNWDNWVLNNLPSGWSFTSSSARPLSLWLLRGNACHANTPAAPTSTPSLTATTGGQLAAVSSSNAPRVKVTYASTSGTTDWYESLPSSAASQVALSGVNNAYTFTLSGNATATGYMRVYRQLYNNAGASDPYYYDGQVAITNGVAHPAYTLTQADVQLRTDITPPVYMGGTAGQGLILPESAALYLLSYATAQQGAGAASGLLSFNATAFMDPYNVALNPLYTDSSLTNAYLGVNNPLSTALMGNWVSTAFTSGSVSTANIAAQARQGYGGAANGVQLRVTGVLNNAATVTGWTYKYFDSTNPTSLQTATITGQSLALSAASGSTASLSITAGRLVQQFTSLTVTVATTGTIAIEAIVPRSI